MVLVEKEVFLIRKLIFIIKDRCYCKIGKGWWVGLKMIGGWILVFNLICWYRFFKFVLERMLEIFKMFFLILINLFVIFFEWLRLLIICL